MDWTTILTALLSFLGGGLGGNLLNRRASKDRANAEARGVEITVATQAISSLTYVQSQIKEIIEEHDTLIKKKNDVIKDRDALIETQQDILLEMRSEVKKIKYIQEEHERIMTGLQNQHNKEKSLKKFAEKLICFEKQCLIRKPLLGTYDSEKIGEKVCVTDCKENGIENSKFKIDFTNKNSKS